jgi:hypothetical protein
MGGTDSGAQSFVRKERRRDDAVEDPCLVEGVFGAAELRAGTRSVVKLGP